MCAVSRGKIDLDSRQQGFCVEGEEGRTIHSPRMIMLTNLCTIAEAPCARTALPFVARQAALA